MQTARSAAKNANPTRALRADPAALTVLRVLRNHMGETVPSSPRVSRIGKKIRAKIARSCPSVSFLCTSADACPARLGQNLSGTALKPYKPSVIFPARGDTLIPSSRPAVSPLNRQNKPHLLAISPQQIEKPRETAGKTAELCGAGVEASSIGRWEDCAANSRGASFP